VLQVGDLRYAQAQRSAGNPADAQRVADLMRQGKDAYDRAGDLWKARLAAAPGDKEASRAVWVCADKVARAQIEFGEKVLAEGQTLLDAGKIDEGVARLGTAEGYFDSAQALANDSLAAMQKLLAASPLDPRLNRDVYIVKHNIGRTLMNRGAAAGAAARADPRFASRSKDAADFYSGAEEWFAQALGITRSLQSSDLGNVEARRDVAVCLNKIGNCERELGRLEGAEAAFRESLSLREQIYASDKTLRHRRDLALALLKLGRVRQLRGDAARPSTPAEAKAALTDAAALFARSLGEYKALAEEGVLAPDHADIAEVRGYAEQCDAALKGL